MVPIYDSSTELVEKTLEKTPGATAGSPAVLR